MTGGLSAGDPSPADIAAADELAVNEQDRLGLVRGRAEKWIGGLTALTGLLATVLVVKGPDSVTVLSSAAKVVIGGLFAAAFVLLAYATFRVYSAAYGVPGELVEVQSDRVVGLAARVDTARGDAAGRVQRAVRAAVFATFVAIGLIAVATHIKPHHCHLREHPLVCVANYLVQSALNGYCGNSYKQAAYEKGGGGCGH